MQPDQILLYENNFDHGLGDFVQEGTGYCRIEGGALIMDDTELHKGLTLWLDRHFEGDLRIEYEATVVEPELYGNINLFFMATALAGGSVLDETHTGAYDEYHRTCRMYIATFVGGSLPDATHYSRLRKNPGFHLLSENNGVWTRLNEQYLIEAIVQGNRITYRVNGQTVHEINDDSPHCGGRMGFRTWNSRLRLGNLRVYSIAR